MMTGLLKLALSQRHRDRAAKRIGIAVIGGVAVGLLALVATGFAIAGLFLFLADAYDPVTGAFLTAAALAALALLVGIVVLLVARKERRKPDPDLPVVIVAGLLAGLSGGRDRR